MEISDTAEAAESEAQAKAIQQVASMLLRPDQLDKVDQYRRRTARKKASFEARLKAAVQSQLDGVKAGLSQLTEALEEVKNVKKKMTEVDEMYLSCGTLSDKMRDIKDVSAQHRQLAAAMENLKHIFAVPEEVEKARVMIKNGDLLEAHKSLTDLETSRDDLLYEQHKLENRSTADMKQLQRFFAEAETLSNELGNTLWKILQNAMTIVKKDTGDIVTVLRIIEREHRADVKMQEQERFSGFIPPDRPKQWRDRAMETLKTAVDDRIESDVYDTRDTDKMWLVRHLEILRKYVLNDLRIVKTLCSPCFPPSFDIMERYVHWYHLALANHLNKLIKEGLQGNEIISLLTWLNGYTGRELLGHPDLQPEVDVNSLPQLLDDEVSDQLMMDYFVTTQRNMSEWTQKSLEQDSKDWRKEEEPETDADGYYKTSLPVILFQMIKQTMQVAETISELQKKKVFDVCIKEMTKFVRSYAESVTSYKEEHFKDREFPPYYPLYMVAIANNCESFIEFAQQMEKDYLGKKSDSGQGNEINELYMMDADDGNPFGSSVENPDEDDLFHKFRIEMDRVAEATCGYLLDEVFMDLKIHCDNLLTKQWLTDESIVETVCVTIEDYYNDFVHLRPRYFSWIMKEAERRVVVEYLKGALGRRVKLGSNDERKKAGEKLSKEQELLSAFFGRLSSSRFRSPCEALIPIAEVIKLQDKSMMPLELSGLVTKYRDASVDQLKALLAIRGDFSANEAKEICEEAILTSLKGNQPMSKFTPFSEVSKQQTIEVPAYKPVTNTASGLLARLTQ
ncbi:exocyst complex component 3-like isoform X1 [Styela clava]